MTIARFEIHAAERNEDAVALAAKIQENFEGLGI